MGTGFPLVCTYSPRRLPRGQSVVYIDMSFGIPASIEMMQLVRSTSERKSKQFNVGVQVGLTCSCKATVSCLSRMHHQADWCNPVSLHRAVMESWGHKKVWSSEGSPELMCWRPPTVCHRPPPLLTDGFSHLTWAPLQPHAHATDVRLSKVTMFLSTEVCLVLVRYSTYRRVTRYDELALLCWYICLQDGCLVFPMWSSLQELSWHCVV